MENYELVKELGELQRAFSLTDTSAENEARRKRIREIKKILGLDNVKPRKNRCPARVVNR